MNGRKNTFRLLGLVLIAFLTAGFDRQSAASSGSGPCIRAPDGCLVCEANGGTCTVEFCPDGSIDHDCF